MTNPQVLVIGLGSLLRGDDAIGRFAAERVRRAVDPTHVGVIDQAGVTPELAAELEDVFLVIFLDASCDGPADEVVVRPLSAGAENVAMTHQLDPRGLLALASRLYGYCPEAYAITFRGQSFELADGHLSPQGTIAVGLLVDETLRLVQHYKEAQRSRDAWCAKGQ